MAVAQEVASLGTAVIGIMSKIQELGNNYYKQSQAWDAFPGQLQRVRWMHQRWQNNLENYGMLSELREVLSTAKFLLDKEEAKLRTKGSTCFCLPTFKAMLFPDKIGIGIQSVIDSYNGVRDMLKAEVDDVDVMEKVAWRRIPSLPARKDKRYVPLKDSEDALHKALNDSEGPAVLLLHGGTGRGKSALAKTIEQHYKERENRGVFDLVSFLYCGVGANTLDVRFQLLQLLHGFDTTDEFDGKEKNKSGPKIRNRLISLLKTRKVLIILDDAFEGKLVESIVELCGASVKVLVTTQNADLCQNVPNSLPIPIQDIEQEDARKILARHAGIADQVIPPDLQDIMDKIITVTEANPLALASLASAIMYRRRTDLEQWEAALQGLVVALNSDKAGIYGVNYPVSFWSALRISLEPLLDHPALKLLILTSICGGPSMPQEIIEFLYGKAIRDADPATPFIFLRNELENREWVKISTEEVAWSPMENRTTCIWSMHSLRRLFVETKMSEDRGSVFALVIKEPELKLDLHNLADETITLTVLGALYFTDEYAQTAAAKLGIPLKNCGRLKRKAIEPIICLLGRPIGDNWTEAAYTCVRQVFIMYICYGMVDDNGVAHLLTCPVSALATFNVLNSILMIEDEPFLDESKQCMMKTLVALLDNEVDRTTQMEAVRTLTKLSRNAHHGKFVASFHGVLEGSMRLLAVDSHPESRTAAAMLLSNVSLTHNILKVPGTLPILGELLSTNENGVLQVSALMMLSNIGIKGHEAQEEILKCPACLTQMVSLLGKPGIGMCAAMAIANLASGKHAVKAEVLKFPGVLENLVDLLGDQGGSQAQHWQAGVAMALSNFANGEDDDMKRKITEVPGSLVALVDAMSKHDKTQLQRWATSALGNLVSGGDDLKAKILKFPGFLRGVVDLLSKHKQNPGNTEAVRALACLALGGDELKVKLVKFPGVLHELVELLFKHADPTSQEHAVQALAALASGKGDLRTEIFKVPGVLDGLVEMLSCRNARLQRCAAGFLCNLANGGGEIIKEILKFPGVLDGLVKMLCTREDVHLQESAATTLANLGGEPAMTMEMLTFPGILKGLVELALTSDDENSNGQQFAVWALCNFASGGDE